MKLEKRKMKETKFTVFNFDKVHDSSLGNPKRIGRSFLEVTTALNTCEVHSNQVEHLTTE